jgi:hypothetical protein
LPNGCGSSAPTCSALPPCRYDLILSQPSVSAAHELPGLPPEYRAEPGLGPGSGR